MRSFQPLSKSLLTKRLHPNYIKRNKSQTESIPQQNQYAKLEWNWKRPEGHDTGIMIKNSYLCCLKGPEKTVPFIVKDPNYVTWYICGPTVYASSHLGHALCYVRFDIIRRVLNKYFNLNICQVMGITNVDNKISNKALLYDANIKDVANYYTEEFKHEMQILNVLPPTMYMPVMSIMPQIIHFVEELLRQNKAYATPKGDVYYSEPDNEFERSKLMLPFDVDKQVDDGRRSIKDFVVWRAAAPGEPYWDAPWGKGRPGWHIECSVAGSIVFGGNMDIHSGGLDLKVPHHEYELTQSEAFHNNNQWVNYFLHTGQLTLPNSRHKMSKSIEGAWLIKDILKTKHPWFIRMLCLYNEYDQSVNLSKDVIRFVDLSIRKIEHFNKMCQMYINHTTRGGIDDSVLLLDIQKLNEDILKNLQSNISAHAAMKDLLRFVKHWSRPIELAIKQSAPCYDVQSPTAVIQAFACVTNHLQIFGFVKNEPPPPPNNPLYKNYPQFQD